MWTPSKKLIKHGENAAKAERLKKAKQTIIKSFHNTSVLVKDGIYCPGVSGEFSDWEDLLVFSGGKLANRTRVALSSKQWWPGDVAVGLRPSFEHEYFGKFGETKADIELWFGSSAQYHEEPICKDKRLLKALTLLGINSEKELIKFLSE